MSSVALEFNGVWKKFKKGERFDCLRDLIPAGVKSLFSTNHRDELKAQEFWAVRDVSFQVRRGEAVGIIGANGSGKSTTLKLLSGILKPTQGSLKVNGRLSALIEVAAGFHPDLTGRENVYLNGTILGMRNAEIDRKFDEIVAFSGLEEFIDTPVKRYSSGMYARLGFSVAAHVDPDILLVDEVLSVGDMSFQQRCMDKMQEKITSDVAVIFVSHNLAAVANLCSRAILLNKGALVLDGPCEKAVQAYAETMKFGDSRAERGDPKLHILDADFRVGDKQKPNTMKPHTPCELTVTFQCIAAASPFNVGLIIRRTQDLYYCYGASTEQLGYPLFQCNPGDRLTLKFQFKAHLARGHYRIDLNVRDPRGAALLLQSNGVATFTIDEQVSQNGIADIGLRAMIQGDSGCEARSKFSDYV
jgi:ABC-type polysaccharide/polyol phosphate transport system ATPase subunit